eukprot:scaffold22656_cov36-Phaeocystis_antarctica.AAC.1
MACAAAAPSPCRAPARVLRQHAEPAQVPAHPLTSHPRRPSLWGGKLCRRLLILILRRRLQAWSPRNQSPCGSSATRTSRAPRPSAAHATAPPPPARCLGRPNCQLVAPSGMRRPKSPPPSRPASLRSYRTTSPPLSSGRRGRSRPTSCPATAAAAAGPTANNGLPLWPATPQVVFNYQVSLPHYSTPHFLKKAAERCAPLLPSPPPAHHAV